MKCYNCNKDFYIKRKLSTFLSNRKYLVCEKCFKSNFIELNLNIVPLDNGRKLNIYSLMKESFMGNSFAFLYEYSWLVSKMLYKNIILMEDFYLNEENLFISTILSNLTENDVTVVCYRSRN